MGRERLCAPVFAIGMLVGAVAASAAGRNTVRIESLAGTLAGAAQVRDPFLRGLRAAFAQDSIRLAARAGGAGPAIANRFELAEGPAGASHFRVMLEADTLDSPGEVAIPAPKRGPPRGRHEAIVPTPGRVWIVCRIEPGDTTRAFRRASLIRQSLEFLRPPAPKGRALRRPSVYEIEGRVVALRILERLHHLIGALEGPQAVYWAGRPPPRDDE